jgi:hypothetical protein
MIKGEQVRPRCRSFQGTSVYGLEEIIIDDMELRTSVFGLKVANKANSAGMQGRRTRVLPLARSSLPFGYLSSILEPRLVHIHGAAPTMGIDETTKQGLEATP